MKFSNGFKILWWSILLILLSYCVCLRFPAIKSGELTATDSVVLLMWFALALVPIFKEIELPGVKLKQDTESLKNQTSTIENSIAETTKLNPSKYKEALEKFDNPLMTEQIKSLKGEMQGLDITTSEEKEEILYKALASNQIARAFETIYYSIFGSQIKALQHLNQSGLSLINVDQLQVFYNEAKTKYPVFYSTYTFESWLNYLQSSVLILSEGGNISITIRGQELLKYLIAQRYSFDKAG